MKLILDVNEHDIATGWRSSAEQCPIAQALRRCGFQAPMVYSSLNPDVLEAWRGDWGFTWRFTKRAQQFTEKFDEGKAVKPQRFQFRLVQRVYDPMPYEDYDLEGLYE